MLRETKDGIVITLKISPNASKNEIIKSEEGLKVKITAQPIDGKANKALIEYLSKQLKIPKSSIEILKGETSKEKTLLIKVFDEQKVSDIKEIC
jgi:TIGR00251 family protein